MIKTKQKWPWEIEGRYGGRYEKVDAQGVKAYICFSFGFVLFLSTFEFG